MIKIVKPGKTMPEIVVGKCRKCECVIECLKTDIIHPDQPAAISYVDCPNPGCDGNITSFKEKRRGRERK